MPDWGWIICLFVGMSLAYIAGYKLGKCEEDAAPTTNAWVNVRKYGIDSQKETEIYRIDREHEFDLQLMERGCYDNISGDSDDEKDEE